MDAYALIIAGGVGARFWPRSREHSPKQLLEIIGKGTMIQNTVYRLDPIVPRDRILIITNAHQAEEVRRQLPQIPAENIIIEPFGRNTAPAIGLGAEVLRKRVGDAVMVVLPADHLVHDIAAFQETLQNAISVATESRGFVTVGVTPTRPETGYGYIQFHKNDEHRSYEKENAYKVVTFAEKPNLETAQRFLESGDFAWNSGMFIWRVSTILNGIAEHLPELADELGRLGEHIDTEKFDDALERAYGEMRPISIDYGVMEKADDRYVIPADFGWNDLGSWDEVARIFPKNDDGNASGDNTFLRDVKNCHVSASGDRYVAAIGVEDLIIIDTDDAVLVCRKGRSQDVKDVVDHFRKKGLSQYL
ncbi:MAG: mannose-1-phosphate guanylyltransferase [Ignavibacteria bacterium]|nr:MAG: mannose-1-phosphate guanylyltransferase [Ignavibacteria bacterium]